VKDLLRVRNPYLSFQIQDAKTSSEQLAVRNLLSEAFEVRPGVGHAFAQLYGQVLSTPAHSRIAVCDGQVIGHALLALRPFGLGDVVLQGGIVAMVVVGHAFRGQGIGRALIGDLEVLARKKGVLMLHVAGDPRFYTQYGFIPAYVEANAHMAIAELPCSDALRLATIDDVSLLSRLSLSDRAFGAVVADDRRWQWMLQTQHPKTMLLCNDLLLGIVAEQDACLLLDDVGFVRVCWAGDRLVIYEAGCVNEVGADRLLLACLAWGDQVGCKHLMAFLPPRNRLLITMSQYGAEIDVHEDHELQAKILDMPQILIQMSGLFKRRMLGHKLRGRLGLTVGTRQVEITVGDDVVIREVDVVGNVDWHLALSEGAFVRVLLGVDQLCDPEGDSALDAFLVRLFPKRGSFFWLADSL
jgi:predicted N-acetyltransferase YhbS